MRCGVGLGGRGFGAGSGSCGSCGRGVRVLGLGVAFPRVGTTGLLAIDTAVGRIADEEGADPVRVTSLRRCWWASEAGTVAGGWRGESTCMPSTEPSWSISSSSPIGAGMTPSPAPTVRNAGSRGGGGGAC